MDDASESSRSSGLSHIVSRTRNRGKKSVDSGSNSIKSADGEGYGLRSSLEDAIDKIKGGSNEDSEPTGLKKLAMGIGSRRRRKKQEAEDELRAGEEAARGRSVAERGTLAMENENLGTNLLQPSSTTGSRSSLITYDSDSESPIETQPTLSTYPSQTDYLTTSSPLIHSTTLPNTIPSDAQLDGASRASTFSVSAVAASESAPDLVNPRTLRAPTEGSQKRSLSPAGRLKEVLRTRRGSSPNRSPDRKVGGGGTELALRDYNGGIDAKSETSKGNPLPFDGESAHPALNHAFASPEKARIGKILPIDTSAPPRTPPSEPNLAPIIVNTPPTPTDSGSPRISTSGDRATSPATSNPNVVTSPSGNMISHRRMRSASATLGPSKLSNIQSVPLTPTPENGSITPGQGGFFSSVFSAAQNAATTLSNSIANTSVAPGSTRSRSGTHEPKEIESPEVESLGEQADCENSLEKKELAVKTLGEGDLSLSALGISESSSGTNTPLASKFPEDNKGRSNTITSEDLPAKVALSTTNTLVADSTEIGSTAYVDDFQALTRPRSVYEPSVAGEQTPPNGSVFEGKSGIHRSGSIRGALGHRKRGSSAATTGTTIGAAIAAANASVAHPSNHQATPKITGFAFASKKRNRDYHQLFRSVPDDDYLIEDYSCALQRDILCQGRLYVSESHLCFSSNIFGWVTTLVMSFDEIVSVEKRNTALVFKNGLMISTLHAKNIFASFTSRDSTYDLIVGIWKLGHPSLRSSLNGVRIEETGGGDKTEKDDGTLPLAASQSASESSDDSEEGDDVYDEDEEGEDGMSFTQAEGSIAGSDVAERIVSRKPSAAVVTNGSPGEKSKEESSSGPSIDFPGPATHAPTDCTDVDTHYPKILADEVISAPLGKIWSLMFGPASVTWMRNWLTVEQKCLEFTLEDKRALGLDNKVRHYSYIKPLNGTIGPKQTKCVCTETLDFLDLERSVSVTISTQTPDVPSGNVFSTKTKYCLSWAEGNGTRLQMSCAIEWTGKSWLKGPIEKGANDGQVQFAKDIVAALKAAVSSRPGTVAAVAISGKGKKKGRKGRESKSISKTNDGASDTKPEPEHWGLFEPARSMLGPIVDIFKPITTPNMLYGLLVGLLVASWFGFGFSPRGGSKDLSAGFLGTPERVAAYEEMWKHEESELWKWLEERAGMDRLRDVGRMPLEAINVQDKLENEKMDEREVEAAIRVTEEKLRVLKSVVERKKEDAKKV